MIDELMWEFWISGCIKQKKWALMLKQTGNFVQTNAIALKDIQSFRRFDYFRALRLIKLF